MAADVPAGKIKHGRASLIGGLATGACVLALWAAGIWELGAGALSVLPGVLLAAVVAAWVRRADL